MARMMRISRVAQDFLNEENLAAFDKAFQKYQTRTRGVTLEQFKKIVREVMGDFLSDSQLEMIFVKVDSNSTGFLDWEGFLSFLYNILESREDATSKFREATLQDVFHVIKDINQDIICRIALYPYVTPTANHVDYTVGRYVTVSRDGILTFWNQNWQMQKSKNLQDDFRASAKQSMWMLDMVCLPNIGMVAVSSADESIRFYDALSTKLDHLILLTKMDTTITAMDYWFDPINPDDSILVLGDGNGNVFVLHFLECITSKLFGPLPGKRLVQEVMFSDVLHGFIRTVRSIYFPNTHDEWVKQIRYIPSMKSFLSCSICTPQSMVLNAITLGMTKRSFRVHRGITCYDYCEQLNIIATGSIDRCLRIWNPFITTKSIVSLYGHNAPISHVSIASDSGQIISVAEDKCIKVWDLREQACVQTLLTRNVQWGPHLISAVLQNEHKHVFILAAVKIVVIEKVWQYSGDDDTVFLCHRKPLTMILYSQLYQQVVSGCQEGIINFWDLQSGKRVFQVMESHFISHDGIKIPVEITAMALDQSGRRLLTTGRDGLLKMWNVSNGALLKSIQIPYGHEIEVILCCRERVFFGGWNKIVFMCNQYLEEESLKAWAARHTDDIMCMAFLEPSLLVTGSWDGKILIWMLDTGYLHSSLILHTQFVKRSMALMAQWKSTPTQSMITLKPIAAESSALASHISIFKSETSKDHLQPSSEMSSKLSGISIKRSRSGTSLIHRGLLSVKSLGIRKKLGVKTRTKLLGPSAIDQLKDSPSPIITMIVLTKRENRAHIANLIATDLRGFVQVWSTHPHGGALAIFSGISLNDQYVQVITTDSQNRYLYTGDTMGFVRTWYIRFYFSNEERSLVNHQSNPDTKLFPFTQAKLAAVAQRAKNLLQQFTPRQFAGLINIDPPPLLSSFRAHLRPVVQLALVEDKQLLLTGSTDCTIRMYNMFGRYIGMFGDPRGWSLAEGVRILSPEMRVPPDIRKVASATTLQVNMGGLGPNWAKIRERFVATYAKGVLRRQKKMTTGSRKSRISLSAPLSLPSFIQKVIMGSQRKEEIEEEVMAECQYPIGKYFHFLPHPPKKLILPPLKSSLKEMNPVFARLPFTKVDELSLDKVIPLADEYRLNERRHSDRFPGSSDVRSRKTPETQPPSIS